MWSRPGTQVFPSRREDCLGIGLEILVLMLLPSCLICATSAQCPQTEDLEKPVVQGSTGHKADTEQAVQGVYGDLGMRDCGSRACSGV